MNALRKVQAHILEHPETFDMKTWADVDIDKNHVCKTVGCIGGWMALLSLPKRKLQSLEKKAQKAVTKAAATAEIDEGTIYPEDYAAATTSEFNCLIDDYRAEICDENLGDAFQSLFDLYQWPKQFRPVTKTGKVSVTPKRTVKRIDYFLEHGA